ncbi:hypothetical protein XENTR_v10021908 [Xenopus tropicalis]|nr:hypothetical protein XENTR_v10021908 [Xenopus tropicalis]
MRVMNWHWGPALAGILLDGLMPMYFGSTVTITENISSGFSIQKAQQGKCTAMEVKYTQYILEQPGLDYMEVFGDE